MYNYLYISVITSINSIYVDYRLYNKINIVFLYTKCICI